MELQYVLFIAAIITAFTTICVVGFRVFSRFLDIEKQRGERFRAIQKSRQAPPKE